MLPKTRRGLGNGGRALVIGIWLKRLAKWQVDMHDPALFNSFGISPRRQGLHISKRQGRRIRFWQRRVSKPLDKITEDLYLVNRLIGAALAQFMRPVGGQDNQRHVGLMRLDNRREKIGGRRP